jgi:hypothetical protein
MTNIYNCNRCGYNTISCQNIKLHFKRKNICAPILSDSEPSILYNELFGNQLNNIEKKFKCEYCEKSYASVESRCNHKKICKKRIEKNVSVEEQMKQLSVTVEEQQKQIEELKLQAKTSITHQTNIGTQNVQNITINAFGKEDIAYLTSSPEYKKFMINCLKENEQGMLNLTDAIYYNKDHPENHNIKKPNKKDNYMKVYNGSKWQTKIAKETVETVFMKINHELMEFLETMENNSTPVKDVTMKKFMGSVGNALGYDFSMFDYNYDCKMSDSELDKRKRELIALELHHINERTKEEN